MTRLLILAAIVVAVGCDAKSDMGDQSKAETYDASPRFADGAALRPMPPGVVPRGPAPGQPFSAHVATQPAGYEAWLPAGAMPVSVDASLLSRGQQQYEVFCSMCHGRLGNGNGMIVHRGFPPPPSFHVERLRRESDAHFYNVITHGYGAMYAYGDRVPAADRWAIVAYVRALQLAGASASGEDRAVLLIGGDQNSPASRPSAMPQGSAR